MSIINAEALTFHFSSRVLFEPGSPRIRGPRVLPEGRTGRVLSPSIAIILVSMAHYSDPPSTFASVFTFEDRELLSKIKSSPSFMRSFLGNINMKDGLWTRMRKSHGPHSRPARQRTTTGTTEEESTRKRFSISSYSTESDLFHTVYVLATTDGLLVTKATRWATYNHNFLSQRGHTQSGNRVHPACTDPSFC